MVYATVRRISWVTRYTIFSVAQEIISGAFKDFEKNIQEPLRQIVVTIKKNI